MLRVDPEAGRISLSIKAALPEPWETYAHEFHPGDVVQGVVRRVVDFGAFVELRPGLEGLVHVSQISNEHVDKPSDVLQPGQEVTVRVLNVDPERKRISLSMRDSSQPRGGQGRGNRRDRRPAEPRNEGPSGPTLGELFGDLFK